MASRGDTSLRHWLIVFEALLRERMDAEQSNDFDAQLEMASDGALDMSEKRAVMLAWSGEAEVV